MPELVALAEMFGVKQLQVEPLPEGVCLVGWGGMHACMRCCFNFRPPPPAAAAVDAAEVDGAVVVVVVNSHSGWRVSAQSPLISPAVH